MRYSVYVIFVLFFSIESTWAQTCPSGCNTTLENTFLGALAGQSITTGTDNVLIGQATGRFISSGEDNTILGRGAGINLGASSRNTIIGNLAGRSFGIGSGNVFIGNRVGESAAVSNRLYIDNFNTASPLLYGEFDNNLIRINGNLEVTGTANMTIPGLNIVGSNVFLGDEAGANTTGSFNTFVGDRAGRDNTTGARNAFFGADVGLGNTTGDQNAFFGTASGVDNSTGSENSFFGFRSGLNNTTGNFNTFLGKDAGFINSTGSGNVFLGYEAGRSETGSNKLYIANSSTSAPLILGDFAAKTLKIHGQLEVTEGLTTNGIHLDTCNTFIGLDAGTSNTGDNNTFVGSDAGTFNTSGSSNAFFGKRAGRENTTGSDNAFFGEDAGRENTTGFRNSFFGENSGLNTVDGQENSFFGHVAGQDNTSGAQNAFFGQEAGFRNTTGSANSFFGQAAGQRNTTGDINAFFGENTGQNNTIGIANAFFGQTAGQNNETGNENAYFGHAAGLFNIGGSGNVFLGNQAGYFETGSNKLYIANDSTDSPLVYGEFDNKVVNINGQLGVGIAQPERPIHLRAKNAIFRIDRDRDDPGFAIVRYDNGFNNVWKSFYFYTRARGVNDGKFIIADWATNVKGNSTPRLVIANDGNVGIGNFLFSDPSQKLTVNGNVLSTGSFISSDKRLKQNIHKIKDASEKLIQMRGVEYSYHTAKFAERELPEGAQLGFIAQEVEKIFPELVATDAEGYKSVNYDGLIPVLIEAFKTQQKELDAVKEELDELKNNSTQDLIAMNTEAKLFQNQPNPFEQDTKITMYLPEQVQQATLYIYTMQGQTLKEIVIADRGETSVQLEGKSLGAGMYLYALIADNKEIDVKRMILR